MYKVYLKPGKEESLKRFHPWVFSGAIARFDGEPEEGDVVEIFTAKKEFIAKGHFQIGSIAVRVLSFNENEAIDEAFWKNKLQIAYNMRRAIGVAGNPTNNTYRLVHGEGDNLPGLVVDIYGSVAVVQCHSVGMYLSRMAIAEALRNTYGDKLTAIYDKSSQTVPFKAGLNAVDGYIWGKSDHKAHVVKENGEKFLVNWEEGQKTGFFLDQRQNRELVKHYSKGRTVLNTFCYTGGFSVYAASGGAVEVCSVDASERAVHLADENMRLNFGEEYPHEAVAADAVEYLSVCSFYSRASTCHIGRSVATRL